MAKLMQGFPPAAAGQVTLANWRSPPFSRWAFHHVRELIPTADIAHGDARWDIPSVPGDFTMPWFQDFLADTDTDGLAIVHRGRLVFEHYASGMSAHTPHIMMSVSKSMLGLLAGILSHPPLVFAWGIHGQHLFVDRARSLAIAKFSSQAQPVDVPLMQATLQAVARIRELF